MWIQRLYDDLTSDEDNMEDLVHSRIGERMYSDTSGDLPHLSVGKCKNTHTLTDSASRMGWATGLKRKPDIAPVVDEFITSTFVGEHADICTRYGGASHLWRQVELQLGWVQRDNEEA